MASIMDRLLNLTPRGLPAGKSAENITTPLTLANDVGFRSAFGGLSLPTGAVHPTAPYHPPVGGGDFPRVTLHPRLVPPNLRARAPQLSTPRLTSSAALLAPGQAVRKGIVHPGRRLGHTGNPNVGVPGQTRRL